MHTRRSMLPGMSVKAVVGRDLRGPDIFQRVKNDIVLLTTHHRNEPVAYFPGKSLYFCPSYAPP